MKFQKLVFGGIGAAVLGAAGWEIYHLGVERGLERATDASMSKLGASAQGTTQASAQNGAEGENATRRHMKLGLKAGDIDPACAEIAGWLSPVPGGVGPMTVACLMQNVVAAAIARAPGPA